MAFAEDLNLFLADFGVTVTSGAVSGMGILDMPSQVVADGMVLTTDYKVTVRTSQFGGLIYGAGVTVDGVNYQVREAMKVDDGQFTELMLTRLAPESVAAGQDPRTFGLDDLTDVSLASPSAGEVLKYNGTQWVDGADGANAYVFTQSAPASTWTINHNLGYVPSVEVFNSGSQEVDADVVHSSPNQTVIVFSSPLAGFARLT